MTFEIFKQGHINNDENAKQDVIYANENLAENRRKSRPVFFLWKRKTLLCSLHPAFVGINASRYRFVLLRFRLSKFDHHECHIIFLFHPEYIE